MSQLFHNIAVPNLVQKCYFWSSNDITAKSILIVSRENLCDRRTAVLTDQANPYQQLEIYWETFCFLELDSLQLVNPD